MAKLEDAISYLLKNYPHKDELSNARVTKMLYLADWHALINGNNPVTQIEWYFDNYGPFVWDVRDAVNTSDKLVSKSTVNMFGQPKELLCDGDENYEPVISDSEKQSLDHVIKQTKPLTWSSFIKLVYSTYPVASSEKYSKLNLKKLAREYVASS